MSIFDNSLKSLRTLPQRALQEKEKVADFYNQKINFGQEIANCIKRAWRILRKIPKTTGCSKLRYQINKRFHLRPKE